MELVGGVDRVLSGHGVGDEEDLLRVEEFLQRLHLLHQLLVDVEAAGGVHDEHVAAGVHRFTPRFFGQPFDRRSVCFSNFALVNLRLDRLRHNCQLLARGRAIDVHGNQQRTMAAVLEPVRQLARGRGLAGTLQASHQHHGRRLRGKLHPNRVFA